MEHVPFNTLKFFYFEGFLTEGFFDFLASCAPSLEQAVLVLRTASNMRNVYDRPRINLPRLTHLELMHQASLLVIPRITAPNLYHFASVWATEPPEDEPNLIKKIGQMMPTTSSLRSFLYSYHLSTSLWVHLSRLFPSISALYLPIPNTDNVDPRVDLVTAGGFPHLEVIYLCFLCNVQREYIVPAQTLDRCLENHPTLVIKLVCYPQVLRNSIKGDVSRVSEEGNMRDFSISAGCADAVLKRQRG